jgi:hypothetical protein
MPLDPSLANADGSELPPEEPRPHHAGGFWNQPWVQNILPLATSLALHIGLIGVGLALYTAIAVVSQPKHDQIIVPESKSIGKNEVPGGIPHPGLNGDPNRDAAQDLIKDVKDDGFTANPTNSIASAAGGGAASDESSGFLGSNSSSGKGHSTGTGAGQAFGSGTGGGSAPWGPPGGGGGMLPKSNFMGTGGNATKVVYLVDASGSMLQVFGALKQQLKDSINSLDVTAGQQFNIVVFSDGFNSLFKDGMQIASADNKHKAMQWVDDLVSAGTTEPLGAIKFAVGEKPELLYVLTDGFDNVANFDDVVNAFKAGNADGQMHVNCIFLQSGEDDNLVKVLKQIANDGHGEMKIILKSDMN